VAARPVGARRRGRAAGGAGRREAGVGKTRLAGQLAGWAEYGYCASHSRYLSGLRLHLIATLGGLPIGFALAWCQGR